MGVPSLGTWIPGLAVGSLWGCPILEPNLRGGLPGNDLLHRPGASHGCVTQKKEGRKKGTNREVPQHYTEVFDEMAVRSGVARVAAELAPWAGGVLAGGGQQVLALCVLRGAVFFFSDLLKAIPHSIEPAYCRCRGYEPGVNGQMAGEWRVEGLDVELSGRDVLVVDDICDSGRTLAELTERCRARGAASVRTAVLVHRVIAESRHTPDHAAFRYEGREWFTGYGMDDRSWRTNYPSVYVLRPVPGR